MGGLGGSGLGAGAIFCATSEKAARKLQSLSHILSAAISWAESWRAGRTGLGSGGITLGGVGAGCAAST